MYLAFSVTLTPISFGHLRAHRLCAGKSLCVLFKYVYPGGCKYKNASRWLLTIWPLLPWFLEIFHSFWHFWSRFLCKAMQFVNKDMIRINELLVALSHYPVFTVLRTRKIKMTNRTARVDLYREEEEHSSPDFLFLTLDSLVL